MEKHGQACDEHHALTPRCVEQSTANRSKASRYSGSIVCACQSTFGHCPLAVDLVSGSLRLKWPSRRARYDSAEPDNCCLATSNRSSTRTAASFGTLHFAVNSPSYRDLALSSYSRPLRQSVQTSRTQLFNRGDWKTVRPNAWRIGCLTLKSHL